MTHSLTPGVALITGASSGIGAIYAERLARRGHDLVLVARTRDKLEKLARRITKESGRTVEVLIADLSAPADLVRIESRLRADTGITMLVNNAGMGATSTLLESDAARMDQMIALNVNALMRLSHAAAPGFVARGAGTIINISSVVAIKPELLNGVYGATKAFVLAFSQSLRHELESKGVRIHVVLPGATATHFWEDSGLPIENLPASVVMGAEAMVDAALAGLDLGEFATIPSLPDIAQWDALEAARHALYPNLSRANVAPRYAPPAASMPLEAELSRPETAHTEHRHDLASAQ
jgi:uncharacterized protein